MEVDLGFDKRSAFIAQQKLLENYKPGIRFRSIKAEIIRNDELGILLADEFVQSEIHKTLKNFGMTVIRWHRSEGRISVAGHRIHSPDESPERIALRRYMTAMKAKYGRGSKMYFKHIRKIAKRAGIKYKLRDKNGDRLTDIGINLQCANLMAASLKRGNKKLAKAIGMKVRKK